MSELFPQPTFNSSVGINMSGFVVGSSHIACMSGGFFTATSAQPLTAGTYRIRGEGLRESSPATARVGIGAINSAQGANGIIPAGNGPFSVDVVVTHDPDAGHQAIGLIASDLVDLSEFSCEKIA